MTAEAVLHQIGDTYVVAWPTGVTFEFKHLRDHSDGVMAELKVTAEGFLAYWGRLTLASSRGRAEAVKACAGAKGGLAWRKLIDEACLLVDQARAAGTPATPLEPKRPEPNRWLVEGVVPVGETTILFGDGGSGKSLFALAFGVCGLTGTPLGFWHVNPIRKVLYLDWESSRTDHEARLWGLLGPLAPIPEGAILYRPMTRPAAEEASELRGLVAQHGVDLVICDSLGPACGAEPETAGAATAALNALRSCAPATRLVIAHVSKAEADRTQGHSRPFGSVYVYNLARSVVEAKRSDSTDEDEFTLTLTHTKANSGPRKPQSALRCLFSEEGYILMKPGDPDLARATLATQILSALRAGGKSAATLADELDRTKGTVSKEISRLKKFGKVVDISAAATGRGHNMVFGLPEKSGVTSHESPAVVAAGSVPRGEIQVSPGNCGRCLSL